MKKKVNPDRKINLPLSALGHELKLTGHENHHITLNEASVLTRTYREQNAGKHIAEFFGKKAILDILSQSNCVGIRIYYGQDPKTKQQHLVIVGVDPDKNDLSQGLIAERGLKCPSCCGLKNTLNS